MIKQIYQNLLPLQLMKAKIYQHIYLDSLIYTTSNKKSIYEKILFKKYLMMKKKRYISDFNPIIIGGCPRSGTTLARALIGIHPKIASPEMEYNALIYITYDKILQNKLNLSQQEIDNLKSHYKDHIFLAENILKYYMIKNQKNLIAIKHPYHILILDELFHYFPKMKFIHMIRDGRDTACSLRTHPKRKKVNEKIIPLDTNNPFNWCIRRWVTSINLGMKWRDNENYLEIKYEDLVNNTDKSMNKIFDFIGVNMIPQEKIQSYYKHQNEKKHLQNIEVGQPIYKKTIGRWKKDMNNEEIQLFKKMAGEHLIKLNYEKDINW